MNPSSAGGPVLVTPIGVYDPTTQRVVTLATDGTNTVDTNGEIFSPLKVSIQNVPGNNLGVSANSNTNTNAATAFWNAANVGAAAASPGVSTNIKGRGKLRIYATANAATTITAQFSLDGVTWFDFTLDNAGTIWTLALVAGHLSAVRDLTFGAANVRLINVTAVTSLTAGYESMVF